MSIAPISIMLVEDSRSDAALLRESLEGREPGQLQFTHVETLAGAKAQLRERHFDVLLLDLSLPDSSGQETFLRMRAAAPDLPIVVLTSAASESVGLEAVRQGIQDYLIKGQADGAQIARAIRYAIERKRAEERNRLQGHMLNAVGQLVIATDLNQSITYWNRAAAELFGWPREAVLGRNLPSVTCPQTTPVQNAEILATLRRGETWTGEITCRRKDGTFVSLLTTNSPILGDGGQPLGVIGIGVDLTERKQAEAELRAARDELELRVQERTAKLKQTVEVLQTEFRYREQAEQALRESEERYRTLFDTAPVGLAVSNHRGELLAVNRSWCALVGVTPQEARRRSAAEFYALPSQRRQLLAQIRKHGKVERSEALLKRKDGSSFLALLRMESLRLGRKTALLTIVQDITKQKHDERRVEGVRELLELFATKTTRQDYVEAVVRFLRDWSGCRCAGIRLLGSDNLIPYAASLGYSRQFLKLENCLSLDTGDCPCVRIFRGQSRESDAQFTSQKGSFFCNRASCFGEQLCADATQRPHLACLEAGYDSLAHAPIRYHGRLLGSIHLADPREDRFPPETVKFIESAAPLIGEALHRFQVEESLAESEQRFRSMFERHDAAMLLVDPEPGTIEDANPAAAAFYGYSGEDLRKMKIEDLCAVPPQTAVSLRQRARKQSRGGSTFLHRLASGEVRTVEVHSSPVELKGRRLLFLIIHDVTERKKLEKEILDIGEAERQRIGRDLHDSLGGMLTGAALLSKALSQRLAAKAIDEAGIAEEVVHCINDSIGQTRAISHGLYPVELATVGLVAGLGEFAAETARRSGISCRLRADKDILIQDVSVAAHLFRIVQEAVNNAIRHGGARHVTIHLARTAGQLLLEVRDDGKGLPARGQPVRGLGLRTMRYRADIIGAQFTVDSSDGRGTVVSCLIPLRSVVPQKPA